MYEELGPALRAFAFSIAGRTAEAEDAVQEVFVNLLTGAGEPLPLEPRPYLFKAVRNRCLNRHRAAAREAARREATGPVFVGPPGLDDLALDLENALGELPDEQRQAVVLRVWAGMTTREAAQVLGVPENTLASRYRYALARLRNRFEIHLGS